jgi:hypothetical protein
MAVRGADLISGLGTVGNVAPDTGVKNAEPLFHPFPPDQLAAGHLRAMIARMGVDDYWRTRTIRRGTG